MVDETNIDQETKAVFENRAKTAVAHFLKRGITAQSVSDKATALAKVLEMIPSGSTVGCGDSVTLHQIGFFPKIHEVPSIEMINPFERDNDGRYVVPGQGHYELMRKAAVADIFLTGVNAVTLDGRLVSIDAVGNRVAPLLFGPRKVIVVAGANKIVRNLEEAMERLKVVAPINVRRHYLKHHFEGVENLPCFSTGYCADCKRPERICSYIVVVQGEQQPKGMANYLPRIHLVIVTERLGL